MSTVGQRVRTHVTATRRARLASSRPPLTSALGGEPVPSLFPLASYHPASDLVLGFPPPGGGWGASDGCWADRLAAGDSDGGGDP